MNAVIGWASSYLSEHPTVPFTDERRKALIERIRKRQYNFTYESHQTLPYSAPFYQDNVYCILTRDQWNSVIKDAWHNNPLGPRLMPEDVIDRKPIDGVLYEKIKWEPKE